MAFKPPEYLQNYLNKEWRKRPKVSWIVHCIMQV